MPEREKKKKQKPDNPIKKPPSEKSRNPIPIEDLKKFSDIDREAREHREKSGQ